LKGYALPRKFLLSWDKANKSWLKTYQGKRHYLGRGSGKYDKEAYQAALATWTVLKEKIDQGEHYDDPARALSRHHTKKLLDTFGLGVEEYPRDSMAWAAQKFLEDLRNKVENAEISPGYLRVVKWGIRVFITKFAGPKSIRGLVNNQKTGLSTLRLSSLRTWLERQRREGTYSASTCNSILTSVRLFCVYCDDHGYIDEMPRGWRRHLKRFGSSRAGISNLADKHIPDVDRLHQVFRWYIDRVIQEDDWRALEMLAWYTLMLNIGGTPIDVAYITSDEWHEAKSTDRLTISRTKTGVVGSFLLWKPTIQMIDMIKASTWDLEPLIIYSRYHAKNVELLMQSPHGKALAASNSRIKKGEKVPAGATSSAIIARWGKHKKEIFKGEDVMPKFSPKHLRKMGADFIARRENLENRLELVRLYLRHSHRTMAAMHYHDRHMNILDPVLKQLYADLNLDELLKPFLRQIKGRETLHRPGRYQRPWSARKKG